MKNWMFIQRPHSFVSLMKQLFDTQGGVLSKVNRSQAQYRVFSSWRCATHERRLAHAPDAGGWRQLPCHQWIFILFSNEQQPSPASALRFFSFFPLYSQLFHRDQLGVIVSPCLTPPPATASRESETRRRSCGRGGEKVGRYALCTPSYMAGMYSSAEAAITHHIKR